MTQTIRDVFRLPTRDEITAQEFVIKLDGHYPPEVEQRLVQDYVFTPTRILGRNGLLRTAQQPVVLLSGAPPSA